MIDVEPVIRKELDRIYPEPDVTPDWRGAYVASGLRRRRNARLAALVAVLLAATAVPAVALSGTVRDFLGLGDRPAPPLFDEAILRVEVPLGEKHVLRLYTAPWSAGGECRFADIVEAGAARRPDYTGGGSCGMTLEPPPGWQFDVTVSQSAAPLGAYLGAGDAPHAYVSGAANPRLGIARMELEWTGGSEPVAFENGHFLAATDAIGDPPRSHLPFFLVGYDAAGREVARRRIPDDWLYRGGG